MMVEENAVEEPEEQVEDQTAEDDGKAIVEGEEETQIVLEGDEVSQPNKNTGIRKRINRKNEELAIMRERNRLLQIALEQKEQPEAIKPPDQFDYEDGANDPGYATAMAEYTRSLIEPELEKYKPEPVQNVDTELAGKQTRHYERAAELGIKDYEDVEDEAISILGKDVVNQLIKASDNSPAVLYYLGKNPAKAEAIKDLVEQNPIKGVLEIGKLEARLTVKKAKRNKAPDPDDELSGASPSSKQQRGPEGAVYS